MKYLTSVGLAMFVSATALVGYGWQMGGIRGGLSEAIAAEPSEVQAEAQKLIGQWEIGVAEQNSSKGILIFAPNGKLYVVDLKQKTAIAGEYQVISNNGQIYLDVMQGSIGSRVTFSINDRGQLVIPQLIIPLGMQYTNGGIVGTLFLPNTLFLPRISKEGKLPADIEITEISSPVHRAKQAEARTYVGSFNRGHQAFFVEKSHFTGKLDELGIGVNLETTNYSYQAVVLDAKKGVQTIGVAKQDGLKSYTGLVYTIIAPGTSDLIPVALLCESKKPTKAKPPRFKLAPEPTCPDGYVLYGE
ncbi:type IV pilin-like G/H family protein [Tumidithrix helvetica]|uniref:type IV pilin-like G/H family protein n=1 Tax=Tumidithrix helvetica TaxID=3457545 RepID=UPI003CC53780